MNKYSLKDYTLEVIDIVEFRDYYEEHKNSLVGFALTAFLKTVDIPAKFFKEQPKETQEELLENRELFVRENKKFFNKFLVVVKNPDGTPVNACRIDMNTFTRYVAKLDEINELDNVFQHDSFSKDGYITLVLHNGDIKKDCDNQVLVIDFPILPTKNIVIHEALFTPASDDSKVFVDHIQYRTSTDVYLVGKNQNYERLTDAVNEFKEFMTCDIEVVEDKQVLIEPEVVSIALVEYGTITSVHRHIIESYISDNVCEGTGLTTITLERLVFDLDKSFKSYKQVTNLRKFDGGKFLEYTKSSQFKELLESMETVLEEVTE